MKKATTTTKNRTGGTKAPKAGASTARTPPTLPPLLSSEPTDWRGETLARVRTLIKQADPDIVEEVKWRKPSNSMAGVPVWSRAGMICTGETYKNYVKLTFAKGAALEDPSGLFNASLAGGTRRAIDIHQGDKLDERAFKALVRAAVALNAAARPAPSRARSGKRPTRA